MKAYQLDIDQIESIYKTDAKQGLNNDINEGAFSDESKSGELFLGMLTEGRNRISYVHLLALICFAISMIFCVLNQTWVLFWCCLSALILFFLLFVLESGALYYFKHTYFKHIDTYDKTIVVVRNGCEQAIPVSRLMIGDVVPLQQGTVLHADARIISSNRLFADESLVFGKTIPAAKDAGAIKDENLLPEDQKNMLWKGSFIASGSGTAIIVALDEDCYVYKTGGREKRGQRSFIYNQRNNIGKILSLVFLLVCVFLCLLAAIISGRWIETIAILGALLSLISLEPVSSLTEWNYYYSAQKLYAQGALVRNIEAFDGMNKEHDIYFDVDTLLHGRVKYQETITLEGEESASLAYFALSSDEMLAGQLEPCLERYELNMQKISRTMPVFRKEKDELANSFCLFTKDGDSMIVASGYWKNMLPYVTSPEEELYKRIEELEIHGKLVYLLACRKMDFIPNSLNTQTMKESFKTVSFVVFDVMREDRIDQMISRLQRSGMRVHLLNDYSEHFGKNLCKVYDMNDVEATAPSKASYSFPISNPNVVFDDASMIEKEKASLILKKGTMPQEIVYAVKCMFCGINRSLNFIAMVAVFLLFSVFTLILVRVPTQSILFPLLLLQAIMICPCYFLSETVRNCNQSKRSLLMGVLFGVPVLIAALIGCDMVLLIPALSGVLYSVVLWIGALKHRGFRLKDVIIIAIALILALLPWLFIGGDWLVALLFAVFPAAGAFILDLIY